MSITTRADRANAVRRYAAGESLREVAQAYDVTPTTVRRWVVAAGVATRSPGRNGADALDVPLDVLDGWAPPTIEDVLAHGAPRPGWPELAACRDPGTRGGELDDRRAQQRARRFYTSRGESTDPALRVCAVCPAVLDCAAEALIYHPTPFGVWGGLTGRQRRQYRHELGLLDPVVDVDEHELDDQQEAHPA